MFMTKDKQTGIPVLLCATVFDVEILECDSHLLVCETNELVVAGGSVGVVARVAR